MHFLNLLWGTLLLRPYVFLFLACYLVLATWQLGLGRTLAFLAAGYLVSWLAELCSIHTGFPFGIYIYIPATVNREILGGRGPLHGFPVLCFHGLRQLQPGPVGLESRDDGRVGGFLRTTAGSCSSWRTTILGGVLMMTLDVVVDPLALRGYRWFLGQIYGYPSPGAYFGIPLTNFAGWLMVALVLVRLLQVLPACLPRRILLGLGPPGLRRAGPSWDPVFTSASWPLTWP